MVRVTIVVSLHADVIRDVCKYVAPEMIIIEYHTNSVTAIEIACYFRVFNDSLSIITVNPTEFHMIYYY